MFQQVPVEFEVVMHDREDYTALGLDGRFKALQRAIRTEFPAANVKVTICASARMLRGEKPDSCYDCHAIQTRDRSFAAP